MLEEADTSAKKMVCHNEADGKVVSLKVYYNNVSNMLYLAGFFKKKTTYQSTQYLPTLLKLSQEQWVVVHETAKEWVSRMTTLVECWNKLEGNVDELSSWVNKDGTVGTPDGAVLPPGEQEISIEKLEGQLIQLKVMFAEKQKLVNDLEAYGPEGHHEAHHTTETTAAPEAAPATAEPEAAPTAAEA